MKHESTATKQVGDQEYVAVNMTMWVIRKGSDIRFAFEDPAQNEDLSKRFAGYEITRYERGQTIPAEWWDTNQIVGLGQIYG